MFSQNFTQVLNRNGLILLLCVNNQDLRVYPMSFLKLSYRLLGGLSFHDHE